MNEVAIEITVDECDAIMLAGWLFAAADPSEPVVDYSVVLTPTERRRLEFEPGIYFYRFDASTHGRFTVTVTSRDGYQSQGFDTEACGLRELSFRFRVNA